MMIVDLWKSLRSINLYKKWPQSFNHESKIINFLIAPLFLEVKRIQSFRPGIIRFIQQFSYIIEEVLDTLSGQGGDLINLNRL